MKISRPKHLGGYGSILLLSLLTWCLGSLGCSGVGQSPEDIANAFVTAYYVDANLDQALNYCDGLSCQKLKKELELRDGQEITADTFHPEVIAKRTKVLDEEGGAKRYVYTLTVKPKETDPFTREAYVKLRQNAEGKWKVTLFAEIAMSLPGGSPGSPPSGAATEEE